jgi:hypothetical protein
MRGAGLSIEVGELDKFEGSTTMAVLNGVEGSTTVAVLDGVEGSATVAVLDGVEGMMTYGTGSTHTKSTMKHTKNGSILSKSNMCKLDLTDPWIDL